MSPAASVRKPLKRTRALSGQGDLRGEVGRAGGQRTADAGGDPSGQELVAGLSWHLGDGHARRLGIGEVGAPDDEAVLQRDGLADGVEGALPLALGVHHCAGTKIDLRLERGIGGEDLALGLVQPRGVQRAGQGRRHLRAPAREAVAVGVGEGWAPGAADRLEHAHQLAGTDQRDGEHRARLGPVAPAGSLAPVLGQLPSARLTGAASAAQAPASSSPIGIELGGVGSAGSAAPRVRVAPSPMSQQSTRSAGTSPRTRRTASQAISSGLRSRCSAWTSAENRSASARRCSRVDATWGGAPSAPRPRGRRGAPARPARCWGRPRRPAGSVRGTRPVGDVKDGRAPEAATRESSSRQPGMAGATTASATAEESRLRTSSGAQGRGSRPPARSASSSAGAGGPGPTTRTGEGRVHLVPWPRQPAASATAACSSESSRRMEPVASRTTWSSGLAVAIAW